MFVDAAKITPAACPTVDRSRRSKEQSRFCSHGRVLPELDIIIIKFPREDDGHFHTDSFCFALSGFNYFTRLKIRNKKIAHQKSSTSKRSAPVVLSSG